MNFVFGFFVLLTAFVALSSLGFILACSATWLFVKVLPADRIWSSRNEVAKQFFLDDTQFSALTVLGKIIFVVFFLGGVAVGIAAIRLSLRRVSKWWARYSARLEKDVNREKARQRSKDFFKERQEQAAQQVLLRESRLLRGRSPRIGFVQDSHEFEIAMADWMKWAGWSDAQVMPVGPDGGIDVKARGALGQAKYWDYPVGIGEVQRHFGAAWNVPISGRLFLAKNGYTPQAVEWANSVGMPLFATKVENAGTAKVIPISVAARSFLATIAPND